MGYFGLSLYFVTRFEVSLYILFDRKLVANWRVDFGAYQKTWEVSLSILYVAN